MHALLQIIVDLSRASSIGDMRPNRLAVMAGVLQGFIRKFFDENPLSHLGLIIMRNGIAERLTELAGSPVSAHSTPPEISGRIMLGTLWRVGKIGQA